MMKISRVLLYGLGIIAALVVGVLGLVNIWAANSAVIPFRLARAESHVLLPMIVIPMQIAVEPVSSRFNEVTAIENAGDERLFIVERQGLVRVLQPDGSTVLFLDLTDRVNSDHLERGLLDIAFHPDFASNGYFYLSYTADDGERDSVVSRFQMAADGQTADPASELHLLRVTDDQIVHNAGELLFHPHDGYLYYALGDDWQPWLAQDPNSVKGKLMRLDLSQEPMADLQPLFDARVRVPVEIIAMGLRNPWSFDLDPASGRFFIADVGDATWEEINLLSPETIGANFGWPCKEGPDVVDVVDVVEELQETEQCTAPERFTDPLQAIERGGNICAVIGGNIYDGSYLFSDLCARELFLLQEGEDGWTATTFGPLQVDGLITTFGYDYQNNLYVGTVSPDAPIYRLTFP